MLDLPWRKGDRPKTHYGQPHQQLSQNAPADIYARLKDQAFDFPYVDRRPTIISVPGAEAAGAAMRKIKAKDPKPQKTAL